MAAANTAITTDESSTPSQRRPDGQRAGRGRSDRGRGGLGASQKGTDGQFRRQEGGGGVRERGATRGATSSHRKTNSSTMNASDLKIRFARQPASSSQSEETPQLAEQHASDEPEADAEVCFICASPVVHNSVTPCNHRTCHICALRMRALYKTKDCAHCRVSFVPFLGTIFFVAEADFRQWIDRSTICHLYR
jgi:E3 ubiquitin-protein ligase ZNF598